MVSADRLYHRLNTQQRGLVGSMPCTWWGFLCVVVAPEVTRPLGPGVLAPEAQMWLALGLRKALPGFQGV